MRVSLFVTCLADVFFAEGAADAVRLLRSLGVEVDFPAGQTCCGQPAFNAGDRGSARTLALRTLEILSNGAPVVVLSGSCAAMLRRFYPELLEGGRGGASSRAEELAGRVYELSELIVQVLGVRELGGGLRGLEVAYHHGCHALRELGLREEPLTLLEGAGARVAPWEAAEECCGFGGLFSTKFPVVSGAMADRKLDSLPSVDLLTSADGGCLLQLGGRLSRRGVATPVQPLASVLWRARSGAAGEARLSGSPAAPGEVGARGAP